MKKDFQKGEIVTIITISTFIFLTAVTFISTFFIKNRNKSQTVITKAANLTCQDNPEPALQGYMWKAYCNMPCNPANGNNDCLSLKVTNNGEINPDTSYWCYAFSSGPRCLQLVRTSEPVNKLQLEAATATFGCYDGGRPRPWDGFCEYGVEGCRGETGNIYAINNPFYKCYGGKDECVIVHYSDDFPYGDCRYANPNVCRRTDGKGGCAGVCNWAVCIENNEETISAQEFESKYGGKAGSYLPINNPNSSSGQTPSGEGQFQLTQGGGTNISPNTSPTSAWNEFTQGTPNVTITLTLTPTEDCYCVENNQYIEKGKQICSSIRSGHLVRCENCNTLRYYRCGSGKCKDNQCELLTPILTQTPTYTPTPTRTPTPTPTRTPTPTPTPDFSNTNNIINTKGIIKGKINFKLDKYKDIVNNNKINQYLKIFLIKENSGFLGIGKETWLSFPDIDGNFQFDNIERFYGNNNYNNSAKPNFYSLSIRFEPPNGIKETVFEEKNFTFKLEEIQKNYNNTSFDFKKYFIEVTLNFSFTDNVQKPVILYYDMPYFGSDNKFYKFNENGITIFDENIKIQEQKFIYFLGYFLGAIKYEIIWGCREEEENEIILRNSSDPNLNLFLEEGKAYNIKIDISCN